VAGDLALSHVLDGGSSCAAGPARILKPRLAGPGILSICCRPLLPRPGSI
jgi:hypothetical protein